MAKPCAIEQMKKMEKKRWYAVYTRPRWEKKVFRLLEEQNIEAYCPLNKVKKKWSDRVKLVEEPLFKSYVFVRVAEEEKTAVRMTTGIVNFVYWLGKPAVIKNKEIETIKRFLNEHNSVEVINVTQLSPNSKVIIKSGLFMDMEATVIRDLRNRVKVEINSLGFMLVANIEKTKVSVIKNL